MGNFLAFQVSQLIMLGKILHHAVPEIIRIFVIVVAAVAIAAAAVAAAAVLATWVKVFRIIPEIRILRLTFQRKSASKC